MQSDHQDRGWGVVDLELTGLTFTAQNVLKFVVNDLNNLLAGGDGLGDRLARGLFLHGFDEIARDGQGHVRLKQSNTYFAQGGFHILIGQSTLLGQAIKDTAEAFG